MNDLGVRPGRMTTPSREVAMFENRNDFLAYIREEPRDDVRRKVYADWLREQLPPAVEDLRRLTREEHDLVAGGRCSSCGAESGVGGEHHVSCKVRDLWREMFEVQRVLTPQDYADDTTIQFIDMTCCVGRPTDEDKSRIKGWLDLKWSLLVPRFVAEVIPNHTRPWVFQLGWRSWRHLRTTISLLDPENWYSLVIVDLLFARGFVAKIRWGFTGGSPSGRRKTDALLADMFTAECPLARLVRPALEPEPPPEASVTTGGLPLPLTHSDFEFTARTVRGYVPPMVREPRHIITRPHDGE